MSNLMQVAAYRRSHQKRDRRPFIRPTMHAPDQTGIQPKLHHYRIGSRRSEPLPLPVQLGAIFMRFLGPRGPRDRNENPNPLEFFL